LCPTQNMPVFTLLHISETSKEQDTNFTIDSLQNKRKNTGVACVSYLYVYIKIINRVAKNSIG